MDREMQWKLLDNHRRKMFLKNELNIIFFKNLLFNSKIPLTYRYLALYKKSKINRTASSTKLQNRCVVTGRIWSIKKFTSYSRFVLRTQTNVGNLPGFRRASW